MSLKHGAKQLTPLSRWLPTPQLKRERSRKRQALLFQCLFEWQPVPFEYIVTNYRRYTHHYNGGTNNFTLTKLGCRAPRCPLQTQSNRKGKYPG